MKANFVIIKEKEIKMGKNKAIDFLWLVFGALFICYYLHHFLGVNLYYLKQPMFGFVGGDDGIVYMVAKNIAETGWTFSSERLGAPFGFWFQDFTPFFLDNFSNFLIKIFFLFTGNFVQAMQLTYFSFPFLSLFISYFVLMELEVSREIAICGALSFALLPAYFFRGIIHFVLSSLFFVPLSILLCVWAMKRVIFYEKASMIFKNKRNILAILFCLLISTNSHGYYQLFSCFFLAITAIILFIKFHSIKSIISAIIPTVLICSFCVLAIIPSQVYNFKNGTNKMSTTRQAYEAEVFGLKPIQLFIPSFGISHRFPKINARITEYNKSAPLVNENNCEFVGFFGCLGLLYSLFVLYRKNNNDYEEFFSRLILSAVLFTTIGGASSFVSYVITDKVRGYNRISVFIAFISIALLCQVLSRINTKIKFKKANCFFTIILTVGFLLIQIPVLRGNSDIIDMGASRFGIQIHSSSEKNANDVAIDQYEKKHKFIQNIERILPQNSMVYQLPNQSLPNYGSLKWNRLNDYQLLEGFIHSNNLRWSYRPIKGRYGTFWLDAIDNLELKNRLPFLSIVGFNAIYIDKRAYKKEVFQNMDSILKKELSCNAITDDENSIAVYPMEHYNKQILNKYSSDERKRLQSMVLNAPLLMTDKSQGIYDKEIMNGDNWRWMKNNAVIIIKNPGDECDFPMHFIAKAGINKSAYLLISANRIEKKFNVSSNGLPIDINVHLLNGDNKIILATDAELVNTPSDKRDMHIMLKNFDDNFKLHF